MLFTDRSFMSSPGDLALLTSLFGDTDSLLPSAEGCICSQLYQLVQEPQGWRHNQFIADLKVSEGRVLFYMTSV